MVSCSIDMENVNLTPEVTFNMPIICITLNSPIHTNASVEFSFYCFFNLFIIGISNLTKCDCSTHEFNDSFTSIVGEVHV